MTQNNNSSEHWEVLVLSLKEIANAKGISQLEISEKSGYMPTAISRFFALKYKPTMPVFLGIARAIGVNFYFEDVDGKTDLNRAFNRAMDKLGRRGAKFSDN